MLKISDFSKLSLVSVKALRYYDERGLLKPARVDPSTGYRFYSASQLTRLNRILAMKDMGLDLSQIALLLDQEPTPDQIRGMLWLKQVELHQQLEKGQARLARIEAWLQAFEQEATMPAYDVVIKSVVALRVAQARVVAPKMEQPELGITLGRLFAEVMGSITQQGATIHHGSFSTMHQAYNAILPWIEANGYHIRGPNRELNLEFESGGDESTFVTEIQFPVEKQ
jgi:DNA-binding transcriptional MerR regulator